MFTEEMVFDAGDQKLAGTMIFADHGRRPSIAHLHGLGPPRAGTASGICLTCWPSTATAR